MRTLIVEDDGDMRRLLELVLRGRGYEVTACADAESAFIAYERSLYPLVLLDWMLPGMDGLELCRKLRGLPHGDRSLILVVTSRNRPEDLRRVLDVGADDYVTKPLDLQLLGVRLTIAEQRVRDLSDRHRAQVQLADTLVQIEKSHGDLLSMLNQLRMGTAMTDTDGSVIFLSHSAERMVGAAGERALGRHWRELLRLAPDDENNLREMCERPAHERAKIAVHLDPPGGQRGWAEIEVQDDPRNGQRKIFYLYDVSEIYVLRRELEGKASFHDIVGKSGPMQLLYRQIQDLVAVDSTVLIEGETGTGKELVARALHHSSRRRGKPFIAVNCGGLTDSLLASQLFGHRRGSFTGAVDDQKGFFEAAAGGTIFLDEVGDIPKNVQTSLLRVLQEREITRVGESTPRPIDVRVVAATNQDLGEQVSKGNFRADLLYRIRVARVRLPPLRERREDIPLLVSAFIAQSRAATGKAVREVSREAMRLLLDYPWPGNVRELRSAIELATIHCHSEVIEPGDLPPELADEGPAVPVAEGAAHTLLDALTQANGNRTRAARLLGISRATFYRRLSALSEKAK
jgi:PAS domain S-box-containing protein